MAFCHAEPHLVKGLTIPGYRKKTLLRLGGTPLLGHLLRRLRKRPAGKRPPIRQPASWTISAFIGCSSGPEQPNPGVIKKC